MTISIIDVLVIIAYFIGVVWFGIWISRKHVSGGKDLFLAGGEMSWPLVGSSVFAANISSNQFVGQAGLAFALGMSVGGFQMIGALCNMLMAMLFVDFYQGLKIATQPEFFERRYGLTSRLIVAAMAIVIGITAAVSGIFYTGSQVLMRIMQWEGVGFFTLALILLGVAIGLYTLMGGLRAVIYTDFVQNIILIISGLVMAIVGIKAVGGFEALATLQSASGDSMWLMVKPWHSELGWLPMITGVVTLGIYGHCCDPGVTQVVLSAKSDYHAKMGMLLASILKILALAIVIVPGIVASKLFPGEEVIDRAYIRLLMEAMPIGILGLCLAGLLAAIMSSVDSGLVCFSSLITYDFINRFKKDLSEKRLLVIGRIVLVVLLLTSLCIAPFVGRAGGVYRYAMSIFSLFQPPIVVCTLGGMFWVRAHQKAAIASMTFGVMAGAVAFFMLNVVPDPSLLSANDIAHPQAFAEKLESNVDPLAVELKGVLGDRSLSAVVALANPESDEAAMISEPLGIILKSLNWRVLKRGCSLAGKVDLSQVALQPETQALIDKAPLGLWATRENRLILEDAWPDLVAKSSIEGKRQELKMNMPIYFQNTYNVGFVLMLLNILVFVGASLLLKPATGEVGKGEDMLTARNSSRSSMTRSEKTRIYVVLGIFMLLWSAVVIFFSPWGIG